MKVCDYLAVSTTVIISLSICCFVGMTRVVVNGRLFA